MNIAIYNGNLKPTTFVLRLAQSINKAHRVHIVGTSSKLFRYKKDDLFFFPTDNSNKIILLFQFVFQLLVFLFINPKKCLHFVSLLIKTNKPIITKIKQFLTWSKLVICKTDVVHIQWVSHIFIFEELLDFSYFKIVVSLRGRLINVAPISDENIRELYYKTFPLIDKFHAVSHGTKRVAMLYGADENKIEVIYSGIELDSFNNFKKTKCTQSEKLLILSVGRQHWIKGYNYALEALKIVLENNIKASYTIIGAADSEEIIYTVHDLDLKAEVRLTPKMDHKDVLKEMQKADVLVLPSVSEGLANVVIEAMALGLPVISANADGMSELVIHKETGLLFENRDVNDLAEIIMDFNTMPQKDIENMSAKALQKVIDQHNWNTFKLSFNNFYKC